MTIAADPSVIIEYPEEDDLPMPEGDEQREYLSYATKVLRIFWQDRRDVYVSGNLFIYYEKGNRSANVAPDTFVVFGIDNHNRGSYKVWEEEGKLPSFVLEITSEATHKRDERDKSVLYAKLGVQEYFQYDPTGKYLRSQPLQGMRLENGKYVKIDTFTSSDGALALFSETLDLELRLFSEKGLRFYDPVADELLRSHDEETQARIEAQKDRSKAEQKVQRLADRLRALGIDPDRV